MIGGDRQVPSIDSIKPTAQKYETRKVKMGIDRPRMLEESDTGDSPSLFACESRSTWAPSSAVTLPLANSFHCQQPRDCFTYPRLGVVVRLFAPILVDLVTARTGCGSVCDCGCDCG